jgi:HlyD family secretion protein
MTKNKNKNETSPVLSPGELGKLIRITEPKAYLALGMGVLMAVVVLCWSIFGFVPRKTTGFGILVPPGGVMDVVALGNGQLTEINIAPGQTVHQGDVIAKLRMPDLENMKESALAELREARIWLEKRTEYFDRTLKIQKKNNAEQVRYLTFRKQYLSEYFTFLKGHVKSLDTLRKSGSVTGKQLEDTKSSMNSVLAQINQCQLDIAQIDAQIIEAKSQAELEIIKAEERISKVILEIENQDRSFETMTKVISPYNGVAVEISAERGDFVGPGSPIAVLKPMEALLEAVVLFPLQTGKKVKPGMMAYIYPSTAGKEEYGCIYGLVAHISEYPATIEGFKHIVGNSHMIEAALSQGEQMLWAKIALLRDNKSTSGFKWSSSKGPRQIEAGTLCDAEVVIDYNRPIDLIFPKFSKIFSLKE